MVKITRSISLLSCLFFLTGCFGIGETATVPVDDSGLSKHSWIGYEVRIPASWELVDNTRITAPVHGKIELAMKSLVNRRGFMNNFVILSDILQTETTASAYVEQSMLWASKEYLTLTLESEEQITFEDGESSRLEVFHAKYNEVTEEHLFMQTARICGKKVYLLTLGLENDTIADNCPKYKTILSTFTCK